MNPATPLAASASRATATTINPAQAIIDFGHRWSPYGGGPGEDIMVEFGWTPRRFFTELETLLQTTPPEHLPPAVIHAMLEVCRGRIWMDQ